MAQLLIAAKARLTGGLFPALHQAAMADNPEGIRLLCRAGSDALASNWAFLGSLEMASSLGAFYAMEELLQQAQHDPLALSRALIGASNFRGGSAEIVERLLRMRADVDFQWDNRRDFTKVGWLVANAASLQHRLGRRSALSVQAYHWQGRTPLMAAVQSAQYPGNPLVPFHPFWVLGPFINKPQEIRKGRSLVLWLVGYQGMKLLPR